MTEPLQVDNFVDRHCGLSEREQTEMLALFGFTSLEDMATILPPDLVSDPPDIGAPLSEARILRTLWRYAGKNRPMNSLIGLGYHPTEMPPVIRRKLLEDPGWYTAYTPYQPEIAQGRLEMLLNFQTLIADLTGMPMAGASLLDEATAAAEAMGLLYRESKNDRIVFLADENLYPQTLAVLRTRAEPLGIKLTVTAVENFTAQEDAFGALISYPGMDGGVADHTATVAALGEKDIRVAFCSDPMALLLLKPPGEMGADLVVGSAQRFGLPMGGGGPHPGFIAFQEKYKMRVPGRIVGASKDAAGKTAYRLSLQSREQHIRREKATSNICTAQALPAMLAAAYAIYHGPQRLQKISGRIQHLTEKLAVGLKQMNRPPRHTAFYGTLYLEAEDAAAIAARAEQSGINLHLDGKTLGISVNELTTPADIGKILAAFGDNAPAFDALAAEDALPPALVRQDPGLGHPVFNSHHTEQQMQRYLHSLVEKDIALNRSMIALGSCTMKLNATIEMEPISWPSFANIHPFAPAAQQQGYDSLLSDLSDVLVRLTGFSAISLQPNAGAQGEYAGLLTIRAYLQSKGETERDLCLIPRSAHGTNAASAVMAGMRVIVLDVDEVGQVSQDDLRAKIAEHGERLAALMLTYPSTYGVFGVGLRDICEAVHTAGGQVYMDGANLNALVGVCQPGQCGPDVMHINLHKTFCIPHGGGGPGMGPIVVSEHLADFLPGHPLGDTPAKSCGTISAAPNGSPLILIISWMYIRLMGATGLRRATLTALLNANYVTRRLSGKFPPRFIGENGFVAHECIVDTSGYKKRANVSVEDIAKRLMDFGFHAPTVSWPVAGAMMIEPTESENRAEMDRFCEAMLHIVSEIEKVERGDWSREDNPLVNAPHTAESVITGDWTRAYTREEAVYPLSWVKHDKYWPPVSRIDAAYGDRNLVCSCPPPEDFAE